MVSAGEVSGDMHAAAVIRELKKKVGGLEVFGMGSEALKKEGAEILIDPTEISTIGYMEAFKNLAEHFKNLKEMKNLLRQRQPDLVFLVDYSGFNMRLAKFCSKEGIPTVNYFPPSAWVYNKGRADKMADYGTHIAAVFPMERDVYQKAGADVTFVGHPLLDLVELSESKEGIKRELGIPQSKRIIGLFPGSRRGEIKSLLPDFLKAAERLADEYSDLVFLLSAAEGMEEQFLKSFTEESEVNIKILRNSNYRLMKAAEFLITASGTTSLEAAILTTPHIICYKAALTTYLLAKYIFGVRYIGLPNIIMEKEIIPELIQKEMNAGNIYDQAAEWLDYKALLKDLENKLQTVRDKLGSGGAVKKTAELLIEQGGLKRNG